MKQIEPISRAHLDAVAAIEAVSFAEPWSARALELLLGDAAVGVVGLDENGCVVAYGGMLLAPDEGQITNIAVLPKAKRQGYGLAVMQALEREAVDRGLLQIALEVRASNEAAVALYEGLGYETVGKRRNFYRHPTEDALVMIKKMIN